MIKISKQSSALTILMFAVLLGVMVYTAGAEDGDSFFDNLNENIRTKPSSLFDGLTGTEFMAQMKEKYGRDRTVTLFSVMSAGAELNEAQANEVIEFLTPEMAGNVISFYTLAMREAGADPNQDDLAAKKMVALLYNDLAARYLAGDPATVELCDKNYGKSAKAKMKVMMRLTTMFLENS